MKFEVIKTYVLVILVGLSLILSYSIWNYQPNYELLSDTDYLDEIDIGGKEQSKKDVIKPTSIIFKNAGQYYGFTNPTADHSLFKDMQSWMMYNFQTSEINHKQKDRKSTRLNSSHVSISYAVFCLKKKKTKDRKK